MKKMNAMEKNYKKSGSILKRIIWDYHISPDEIYDFLRSDNEHLYHFTKEMLYIRILERLSWYEILELFSVSHIKEMLDKETIKKLRSESMRQKYEYARRVLHKEPLSFSRWHNKDNKEYAYPILSDRWYNTRQALF